VPEEPEVEKQAVLHHRHLLSLLKEPEQALGLQVQAPELQV
jgi:hypothetical protein